jgi:O-antigen ligase
VGLPIALVGIAKLLLMVGGLVILLFGSKGLAQEALPNRLRATCVIVLFAIAAFALSMFWTSASPDEATSSLIKYSKLLMIPLLVTLIQTRSEAIYALGAFVVTQIILVLSALMLFLHVPVPWAIAHASLTSHAVFSSYLDEGLMAAVFAAISWHLRGLAPGRFGKYCALLVVALALFNVFFVFEGRSGYVVAIVLISLSIMWKLPRKYRGGIMLFPVVLFFVFYLLSPQVRNRLNLLQSEVHAFSMSPGKLSAANSSSGIRLHFWQRAVQSIEEHPFTGAGLGSWSHEYNRLDSQQNANHEDIQPLGNPHQEYLQWGVQIGIPGILIFAALLVSIFSNTMCMKQADAHAAQSALFALAVACLFNSIIYDALIGDFFCVTIGLLLALGAKPVVLGPVPPPAKA